MEEQISQVWQAVSALGGLFFTGFLFLIVWCRKIAQDVGGKASFKWVEETALIKTKEENKKTAESLEEIKKALVGDFKESGLMTRTRDLEVNIDLIRKLFNEYKRKNND